MNPHYEESQAPPILQGEFALPPPVSTWPKVIGVISIILGALGALMNAWGTVAPLFLDAMASMMPQDPASQASFKAQKDLAPYTMIAAALSFIGSVVLLVGGIGLCLRARWGVAAHKIWIPWRMLTAVLSAGVGWMVMDATLKAAAQQQGGPGMAAFGATFGLAIIAITLVWAWAYPIILLILFSRPKVRAECQSWA